MPELPEVETTKEGLKKIILGFKIKDVWTNLKTKDKRQSGAIANVKYFKYFKKAVVGERVVSVERRAKNILINLSHNKTVLIHLKMTGHLLYGKYKYLKQQNKWVPGETGPLNDPFNRFVHVVFTLSNGKHLAFSDARKFGKITLLDTKTAHDTKHLNNLGPEPLEKNFTVQVFKERLSKKPNGKIKTVLMDQSVLAGIGNIYSDEVLWLAGVNPEKKTNKLTSTELKLMFKGVKKTLARGIDLGGDSMSDYRNIHGLPGRFQLHHNAYRKTGDGCNKKGCRGIIKRKIVNGRSAHFCSQHQILHD
jgi:formamidopyrimidine-DNA glycosylase